MIFFQQRKFEAFVTRSPLVRYQLIKKRKNVGHQPRDRGEKDMELLGELLHETHTHTQYIQRLSD